MLFPGEKKHLGEAAITVNSDELWYDSNNYYSNVESKHVEKWQRNLTLYQKIKTSMAFKDQPELKKYDYDFSLESLTQDNAVMVRVVYAYVLFGDALHTFLYKIVRRIPGIRLLKRGLLAIARFIG